MVKSVKLSVQTAANCWWRKNSIQVVIVIPPQTLQGHKQHKLLHLMPKLYEGMDYLEFAVGFFKRSLCIMNILLQSVKTHSIFIIFC